MRVCLLAIALMLVGCDREIGQPYCGDVISPQDYGQFVVDGEKGIAQHISARCGIAALQDVIPW